MKQWILDNTTVTEDEYDKHLGIDGISLNSRKISFKGQIIDPYIHINNFTFGKPTALRCLFYGVVKCNKSYKFGNIKFQYMSKTDSELLSKKRRDKCHKAAYAIVQDSEDFNIITAWVQPKGNHGYDTLHSFILDTKTNLIYDYTVNAIFEKDAYFDLLNVLPIKTIKGDIVKRIGSLIKSDENISKNIEYREFLVFSEEIERAVVKMLK